VLSACATIGDKMPGFEMTCLVVNPELKAKMQRDLNHAWAQRGGDLSELSAIDVGYRAAETRSADEIQRIAEIRMVEDVEGIQAKFRVQSLFGEELEMFGEREVQIDVTRTAKRIAAQRTFRELPHQRRGIVLGSIVQRQQWRDGKCIGVEEIVAGVAVEGLLGTRIVGGYIRQDLIGVHQIGCAVSRRTRIGIGGE